jgi:hypothetical protein
MFTKSIQSELYGLMHDVTSTSPLKTKILSLVGGRELVKFLAEDKFTFS